MDEAIQMTHGLDQVLALLDGAPFSWAIGGGWAIDLHVGERGRRSHADVDVVCMAHEAELVRGHFTGWDLQRIVDGAFEPWTSDLSPATQVRARPSPSVEWAFEVLFERIEDGQWSFRRNSAVTLPTDDLIVDFDGISVLALGATLLYKAKRDDERDRDDLRAAAPLLSRAEAAWLSSAVAATHGPDHRWGAMLAG